MIVAVKEHLLGELASVKAKLAAMPPHGPISSAWTNLIERKNHIEARLSRTAQ